MLVNTVDHCESAAAIPGSWVIAQMVKHFMERWPALYRDGWMMDRTPESIADGRQMSLLH